MKDKTVDSKQRSRTVCGADCEHRLSIINIPPEKVYVCYKRAPGTKAQHRISAGKLLKVKKHGWRLKHRAVFLYVHPPEWHQIFFKTSEKVNTVTPPPTHTPPPEVERGIVFTLVCLLASFTIGSNLAEICAMTLESPDHILGTKWKLLPWQPEGPKLVFKP